MNKLFRRIGFLDSFTTELKIAPTDLVRELNKVTDKNDLTFSNLFRNDKKEYVGVISEDRFEISKWRTGIYSIGHWAIAYGYVKQEGEKLIVEVDVYFKQRYSVLVGFGLVTIMFFLLGLMFLIGMIAEGDIYWSTILFNEAVRVWTVY